MVKIMRFSLYLILFSVFNLCINCENQLITDLEEKLHSYDRLFNIIKYKICDESTLNGVLHLEEGLLSKINECESLQYYKLTNNSYAETLCKNQIFPNMSPNQVLYQTKCVDNTTYAFCINQIKYPEINNTMEIKQNSDSFNETLKEQIKIKENSIICYKKAFNTDINITDGEKFLGKYDFKRYILSEKLYENYILMASNFTRNESYNANSENEKLTFYLKCYDNISPNCYSKFNETILKPYAKYKSLKPSLYNGMIMYKMTRISSIINLCQTEKYGNMKIKEYYEKESQNIEKLIECQRSAMNLTEREKKNLQTNEYYEKLYINGSL